MHRTTVFFLLGLLGAASCFAEDPAAPPAAPPVESAATETADAPPPPPAADRPTPPAPAADGTVSVVVPPSSPVRPAASPDAASPAAPPAAPPAAAGPGTALVTSAFEPMRLPAQGQGTGPVAIDAAIYARPLPLLEALERSGDRSRRLWVAQAYWKASIAFVSLAWAIDGREKLATTGPGSDPYDRAALEGAVASAAAGVAEAKAELVAAQQELADLARLPIGEPLPWPVDRPLATPYATHFDVIFAQRLATGRVRAINRMLPSKQEALDTRAKAVAAANEALGIAELDHAKGKRPVEAVLAAHAALATQRRQFLELLRGYNTDIAEYVMAVADFSVPDDRFAAMLIGTPSP